MVAEKGANSLQQDYGFVSKQGTQAHLETRLSPVQVYRRKGKGGFSTPFGLRSHKTSVQDRIFSKGHKTCP